MLFLQDRWHLRHYSDRPMWLWMCAWGQGSNQLVSGLQANSPDGGVWTWPADHTSPKESLCTGRGCGISPSPWRGLVFKHKNYGWLTMGVRHLKRDFCTSPVKSLQVWNRVRGLWIPARYLYWPKQLLWGRKLGLSMVWSFSLFWKILRVEWATLDCVVLSDLDTGVMAPDGCGGRTGGGEATQAYRRSGFSGLSLFLFYLLFF